MQSQRMFVCSVLAVVCLLAGVNAFAASDPLSKVVPPDGRLFGKTYIDLVDEWSQWFVLEPFATNPAFDPDGQFCHLNQSGRVFFLATTFGGIVDRTCEIPAGKAVFFSLGSAGVSFAPEFPETGNVCLGAGSTVAQVRCDVSDDVPLAPSLSFQVILDGVSVPDLFAYRAQSGPGGFTLHVPDSSFITDLGLPSGDRYPTVAAGYFLLLKPLRPGTHSLSIVQTNADGSQAGANYTLIVPDAADAALFDESAE